MKTYIHLWQYLATFLLEWEMFQAKCVERIKTHFYLQQIPPTQKKNRAVYEIMWKNGSSRHATYDSIISRMRFACRVTKSRIQTQVPNM